MPIARDKDSSAEDARIRRLRWRCRRGTKELDRILGGFFEEDYSALSNDLKQSFADLLEQQDPVIYDWLMGAKAAEDPMFDRLVQMMRHKFGLD